MRVHDLADDFFFETVKVERHLDDIARVGFVRQFGRLHALEGLSILEFARARAVNGDGQIVGESYTPGVASSEAVVWVRR